MSSYAISFVDCLVGTDFACAEDRFTMDNNIESYRCGSKVIASFCEDYPYKRWNYEEIRYDFMCRTGYEFFSTAGPLGYF